MGIRVEHNPSPVAVGMAAYMAGRGKSRQRQQKYMLNFAQNQARIQARQRVPAGRQGRIPLGQQGQIPAGRQGRIPAGQQPPLKYSDPLAEAAGRGREAKSPLEQGMGRADAQRIGAQRKANARAIRMGKPIPYPEAERQPLAPVDPKLAAEQRKIDQEKIRNDREREEAEAVADLAFQRKTDPGLIPAIPNHLVGTSAGAALNKLNAWELKFRGSRDFDADDEATLDALNEFAARRRKILSEAPPAPSRAEKENEEIGYLDDETGKWHDEPGPGRTATYYDSREPVKTETPETPEQKAAADEMEAYRDAKKKQEDALDKAAQKLAMEGIFGEDHPKATPAERLQIARKELEGFFPVPEPPASAAQEGAQDQRFLPPPPITKWDQPADPQAQANPDVDPRAFVNSLKEKVARGEQLTPQEIATLRLYRERLAK